MSKVQGYYTVPSTDYIRLFINPGLMPAACSNPVVLLVVGNLLVWLRSVKHYKNTCSNPLHWRDFVVCNSGAAQPRDWNKIDQILSFYPGARAVSVPSLSSSEIQLPISVITELLFLLLENQWKSLLYVIYKSHQLQRQQFVKAPVCTNYNYWSDQYTSGYYAFWDTKALFSV